MQPMQMKAEKQTVHVSTSSPFVSKSWFWVAAPKYKKTVNTLPVRERLKDSTGLLINKQVEQVQDD